MSAKIEGKLEESYEQEKHRDPNNQNICFHYYNTLKQYRAKQEQHTRTQLSETEQTLESNQNLNPLDVS